MKPKKRMGTMRYSIEIIQRTGANGLVYGDDAELPGQHVKVFTGRDAVASAQAWLDKVQPEPEEIIHFWDDSKLNSACGVKMLITAYAKGSDVWEYVTCGACKLEQPMQEVPGRVEYRVPAHVLATDAALDAKEAEAVIGERPASPSLAELQRVVRLSQMIEQTQQCREHAAAVQAHWAGVREQAQKLEMRLQSALAEALGHQQAPGVAEGGSDISTPQGAIQEAGQAIMQMGQAWGEAMKQAFEASGLAAAVDIRTGRVDTGDMRLSSEAKSALINTASSMQGQLVDGATDELRTAGLIGANGGLTRAGSIKRESLVRAAEDAAFG